jgi:hypothetical protein
MAARFERGPRATCWKDARSSVEVGAFRRPSKEH